jgi:hypothetical protein
MNNAHSLFERNMQDADSLSEIYGFLKRTVIAPTPYEDLLRSKIVYCISAFDKLLHDLITEGMVQSYAGKRPPTKKYLSELLSIENIEKLKSASTPPAEIIFRQIIQSKLKTSSFQDPTKVADGLSYIWAEEHKWRAISAGVGLKEDIAKTTLKLIVGRRNAIVHEADMDPITNEKLSITEQDCQDSFNFIYKIGSEIFRLVK